MIGKPATIATGVATLAIIIVLRLATPACFAQPGGTPKKRVMENLGRGVVALNQGEGKVFVSWRLLGTDPDGTSFNVYGATGDERPVRLNQEPITRSTHFVDGGVDLSHDSRAYFVRPIVAGREGSASSRFVVPAQCPAQAYLAVPLKTPTGYTANDAAVGDLDGDGEYELIVKQELRGWGKSSPDVGRGVAFDIDPRHRGYEMWASGPGLTGLWNVKGETICDRKPRSCNFGVWWDGDLLRELLDRTTISKWNPQDKSEQTLVSARGCASNNSTKANPCLCADIFGDWREEVIWRTTDSRELRIYTTTIPTDHRLYTLMHDSTYRLSAALQNVGYNQPTQPGFYLGDGMKAPPRPSIRAATPPK